MSVVVPRPGATVMVLRDGDEGLEVLLLRRGDTAVFVPGVHVFPGGAVDDGDHDLDRSIVRGLDDETADDLLGTERALQFWVAAVRECLEEAGVLLAAHPDGRPIGADHPVVARLPELRFAVERGDVSLADVYRDHDLVAPLGAIAYAAHWVTPAGPPRRFDTRFFAAALPPGQVASADDTETTDARWWTPAAALADWQAGHIQLIEPTFASLRLLSRFDGTASALAALDRGARSGARVTEPEGGVRVAVDDEVDQAVAGRDDEGRDDVLPLRQGTR